MIQTNINQYDRENFSYLFKKTELYKKLQDEYDIVNFSIAENALCNLQRHRHLSNWTTPRKRLDFRIFDAVPFYYLNYLIENNPNKIYDIGCGYGEFKKYIPNIVNIEHTSAKDNFRFLKNDIIDLYDDLDENFYIKNSGLFESAFAINSLHFNSLIDIRKIVIKFSSLISKNGRGFIALNIARMIESELDKYGDQRLYERGISKSDMNTIEDFVRSELFDLPFELNVFEFVPFYDCYLNGNVRIVFTK
jgi:SAM-dependent methyltransferase